MKRLKKNKVHTAKLIFPKLEMSNVRLTPAMSSAVVWAPARDNVPAMSALELPLSKQKNVSIDTCDRQQKAIDSRVPEYSHTWRQMAMPQD